MVSCWSIVGRAAVLSRHKSKAERFDGGQRKYSSAKCDGLAIVKRMRSYCPVLALLEHQQRRGGMGRFEAADVDGLAEDAGRAGEIDGRHESGGRRAGIEERSADVGLPVAARRGAEEGSVGKR